MSASLAVPMPQALIWSRAAVGRPHPVQFATTHYSLPSVPVEGDRLDYSEALPDRLYWWMANLAFDVCPDLVRIIVTDQRVEQMAKYFGVDVFQMRDAFVVLADRGSIKVVGVEL